VAILLAAAQMSKHCRLENFTQVKVVLFAAATPGQNNVHARRGQSHPSATVFNPQNATFMLIEEEAKWHAGMKFKKLLA